MNSQYLNAKRKFAILRRRLQPTDAKDSPDTEKHLEVVKNAVREQFPIDMEAQRFEGFFREFAKVFSIGQDAKGHYVAVYMKKFGSPSKLEGVAAELELALSYPKQPKKVIITEQLISYCAQQFLESVPELISQRRNKKVRNQVELAVRKSLAQFLN